MKKNPYLILFLFAFLSATPVDFSKPGEKFYADVGGVFRYYTPAVIRPDEGTIEVLCRIDQPLSEFGNDWDFAWTIAPVREITKGGNTLMGLFVPARAWKQGALRFIARNGVSVAAANSERFNYEIGKPFVLSCSWGKEVRLYMNGKLLASGKLPAPIPADLFPYAFKVERFGPFNVQALRISSKELDDSEIAAGPGKKFDRDEENTTFIAHFASDGSTKAERFVSSWYKKNAYAYLMPALRETTQVFVEGESQFFPFLSINTGSASKNFQVELAVDDIDGKNVEKKSVSLAIDPKNEYAIQEIALSKTLPRGFYKVKATVKGDGAPLVTESAVAILPGAKNYPVGKLAEYYGQHPSYDFDNMVLAKGGVRWARGWARGNQFMWSIIEPVPGQYDFRRSDIWVKEMEASGMQVLGMIGYPPRWAAAEPDEAHKKQHELAERSARWKPGDLKAFEKYVETTVKHYKGRIKYWEVYNEVNFHPPAPPASFSGSTEDYLELLKIVYKKVKEIDPSIKVLISGFSTPPADQKMPIDLLKKGAGDYFDIFNFHGYAGIGPILPWLEELKKQKPGCEYWMTEQMWFEVSDLARRMYLTPELYLQFLEIGTSKFFNMGIEENFFNRFSGSSPAPDFLVATVLHRQVGACDKLDGKVSFEGEKFFPVRYQLRRADGKVLSVIGAPTGNYELSFAKAPVLIEDIYGRPLPTGTSLRARSVVYLVTDEPLKITKADLQQDSVLSANGGFETMSGDSMGGLSGLKPMQWLYRDKAYDPQGVIIPTDKPRQGKFAMRVESSGAGRVYLFQDILLRSPGNFTLTAWIKKESGDPTPYFFIFDRNKNKVENKNFEAVGSEFVQCSMTMALEPGQSEIAIGLGVAKGQGSIVVDDVSFGPEKPRFDGSRYQPLDFGAAANFALADNLSGSDNFSKLETGERVLASHSFRIEKESQKNLIALGGSVRGDLAKQSEIPVKGKGRALVFLHTAYGVKAGAGEELGSYTVRYSDGSSAEIPLKHKENIDDWYRPVADPKVSVGDKLIFADGVERLLFVSRWVNPDPSKTIQSIRMSSQGKAVLILAAASLEK